MPSLTAEETQTTPEVVQQPEESQTQPPTEEPSATISVPEGITDLSTTTLADLNESETSLMITGEDGTVYQVAGQNEHGQTILISQGTDGQSQCLVVATESLQLEESQVVQMSEGGGELQQQQETMIVDEASVVGGSGETPEGEGGDCSGVAGSEEESMVAQLISADPPSPGWYCKKNKIIHNSKSYCYCLFG